MPNITILAFGDSLTAGFGLPQTASLAQQLADGLHAAGYRIDLHNHGISGETTADGLARIQSSLRLKPDLVLLELGINDALMGVPAQEIKANLEELIQACLQAQARVILAGFRAVPGMPPLQAEGFNALYPDLAQAYDLPLFPDFMNQVLGNPELTLPDGLHPNAQGIAFIVQRLMPLVQEVLDQMGTAE